MSAVQFLCGVAAVGCVLGGGSDALAQSLGTDRPFRGLFGGRGSDTGRQALNVSATLVQAYDDIRSPESGGTEPRPATRGGYFAMLQAAADYAWGGQAAQLTANAASAGRYFGHAGQIDALSYSAGIGLSMSPDRRTTVLVGQTASYSPSYLFRLFPAADESAGEPPSIAPDYAIDDEASLVSTTTASVSRGVTRRGALSGLVDYSTTNFQGHTSQANQASYGVRAGFSRTVGRRSGLRAGYHYRNADFGALTTGPTVEHGLQLGVNHTRLLSATRSASFSFDLGLSAADHPALSAADHLTPDGGQPGRGSLYRATTNATASYQFGRAWQVRGAYRRSLEYMSELIEPVFTGGVTAAVGGLISRRLDLLIAGGYSSGEGAVLSTSSFTTYTANVRSRLAVTQTLAIYLQYLYYFYEFGGETLLAPGLSPRFERNGVRVGVAVWLPAFKR